MRDRARSCLAVLLTAVCTAFHVAESIDVVPVVLQFDQSQTSRMTGYISLTGEL